MAEHNWTVVFEQYTLEDLNLFFELSFTWSFSFIPQKEKDRKVIPVNERQEEMCSLPLFKDKLEMIIQLMATQQQGFH